jgi:ribosomal protein S12 methylthiotransferase
MSTGRRTFFVETLGCPKNQVDSDKLVGTFLADGMTRAAAAETADLVVVNTCAFIEEARQESIDVVLGLVDRKAAGAEIVVTGCMAERYGDELAVELPEVDAVVGFAGEGSIGRRIPVRSERPRKGGVRDLLELPRAAPAVPWAYLKAAEGCDRACAFCAIPSFRGEQRSREPDALVAEARDLVAGGVAELVLVAQDLAWYGRDAGEPGSLAPLLRRLDAELAREGLARVRLLYLYPSEVHDPLVQTILDTPTTVPYFDLSLQHADRALLARMKRWGSGDRFLELIGDIRDREPDATFRSSFIVGFPGEAEPAHDALLSFLDEAALDWAGFFPFSEEAGTPAATLDGAVPADLMAERLRECDEVQSSITLAARDRLVRDGTELEVLVETIDDGVPVGRSSREAPEIDAVVRLAGAHARPGDGRPGRPSPEEAPHAALIYGVGDVVRAKVIAADGLDLDAEPIEVLT